MSRVRISPFEWRDEGPASARLTTDRYALGAVTGAGMMPVLRTEHDITPHRRAQVAAAQKRYRERNRG